MSITPMQKTLVQSTFASVANDPDAVAALFYGQLFQLDPSLKAMFKGDMKEQGRKLMQILAVAVASLDKLDTLIAAVQALGKRHIGYGVEKRHYDTVGAALLWTLEQGLGSDFTVDARDAWASVYGVLVSVATEGLYEDSEKAA